MFHSFQLKGSGLYIAGSESLSEHCSLTISRPITERLRLKLQPGHSSSFSNVGAELAAIMKKEPGTRGVYWGLYEEEEDTVDVLVCPSPSASMLGHDFPLNTPVCYANRPLTDRFDAVWDSLESHDTMAANVEKLAPILLLWVRILLRLR